MRGLIRAKTFVAPVVVIWSVVLVGLDLPGGTAFALFGSGWITYGIVDTLESITDRRARRREAKDLLERGIITPNALSTTERKRGDHT